MKKLFLLLAFSVLLNIGFAQNLIRVMTYNLRYDNAGDAVNQWGKRIYKVDSLLKKYSPDILGVQEGLNNQIDDLTKMKALKGFQHVGVGRDDGKTKGEFSAIFFNDKKYALILSGTFWLSKTPEVAGSKGWGAACVRICTYAKLKNKSNGKMFFVFNTHFDHISDSARRESAKLILQKIKQLADTLPVILTGDFNSEPTTSAYQTIVSNIEHPLFDSHDFAVVKQNKNDCTFTGFEVKTDICKRIDFIFSDKNFKQILYQIIDDNDGTYYLSDHKPVMAELKME